ncbi:MAG: SH3 domain-containing protein [Candidatus Binatia bacterium]
MTEAKESGRGAGATCPDFENLSRFADGELDSAIASKIQAHLDGCPRCRALALRLREGFGASDPLRGGGIGGSGCVGEEHLLLYAMNGTALGEDERHGIADHVGGCDACVAALQRLQRRLGVAADVATPVPAAVQMRARSVVDAALHELARETAPATPLAHQVGHGILERLRSWLRVPVLVPIAAAGAAVLMLSVGRVPMRTGPATEQSRALPAASTRLRVTVSEAPVYSRPSGQSQVITTVRRGAMLEVAGEERDWYEVRLEGGNSGWVVREAFE